MRSLPLRGAAAAPNIDAPASGPRFDAEHTPFAAIGGEDRVRALVDAFYDRMDRDPRFAAIRALHKPDLSEARRKLFMFLCGWLGGPPLYVERYGHPRLRARHAPFSIGETERDLWLTCMSEAMDSQAIAGDLRAFLEARFRHVATFMMNR